MKERNKLLLEEEEEDDDQDDQEEEQEEEEQEEEGEEEGEEEVVEFENEEDEVSEVEADEEEIGEKEYLPYYRSNNTEEVRNEKIAEIIKKFSLKNTNDVSFKRNIYKKPPYYNPLLFTNDASLYRQQAIEDKLSKNAKLLAVCKFLKCAKKGTSVKKDDDNAPSYRSNITEELRNQRIKEEIKKLSLKNTNDVGFERKSYKKPPYYNPLLFTNDASVYRKEAIDEALSKNAKMLAICKFLECGKRGACRK